MDSISLIELLEDEFLDKKGYFKRKIDVNRCMQIVAEIKNSLPACIKEAQDILNKKQQILQNADVVAQNTIAAARQRVEQMFANSEVGLLARQEANKIVGAASVQRNVLIDKTKNHLDNTFEETEKFLLGIIDMIRKNRQELKEVVFN